MVIKKLRTKYHKYLFQFDFNWNIVKEVKSIQSDKLDKWNMLVFNKSDYEEEVGWAFSSKTVYDILVKRFNPAIEKDVEDDFSKGKKKRKVKNRIKIGNPTSRLREVNVPTKKKLFGFQKKAVNFISKVKGRALVADEMGCLSGMTKIKINRGGNCREYLIEQIYERFNGLDKRTINNWKLDSYTRSLNEKTGIFELNKIEKVLKKGLKFILRLKTKSGKEIELTDDHEILTENGWVEAGRLNIGDRIYVNGKQICKYCGSDKDIITYKYARFKGVCKKCVYKYFRKNKNDVWEKVREGSDGYIYLKGRKYWRHPRYTTGGLLQHVYLAERYILKRYLSDNEEVHHRNKIRDDNRISNLEVLTKREHSKRHKCQSNFGEIFVPKLEKIVSIKKVGLQKVYDIVMANPHRNFIANGIIVHNCGKTIEAIGYVRYKKYKGNILVVCPVSVKENWKREIKKFSGNKASIIGQDKGKGKWDIVGYPSVEKLLDKYLLGREYKVIILDECHFIKNRKAQRTKAVLKLLDKSRDSDVLFLTGTPILNRPVEIYNVFNFIVGMPFWGDNGFANTYCDAKLTRFGWDTNGASNMKKLKRELDTFMIRRTKAEVLKELPNKTVSVLNSKMKSWKEYNRILSDYRNWLKDKNLNEAAIYAEALTKVGYLKQEVVKNKDIAGTINNFLDNGKKVLVFGQYKDSINELSNKYSKISVKLTGDTPVKKRQGLVDKFQESDKIRLFFSTIKAGGVGLTLTKADTVLFIGLDWTPANHSQAEDRAYRIGQKNNVNVYYLVTPGTIEENIWKMLQKKTKIINRIVEGKNYKTNSISIKSVLESIK